jgi:hypothetical protein
VSGKKEYVDMHSRVPYGQHIISAYPWKVEKLVYGIIFSTSEQKKVEIYESSNTCFANKSLPDLWITP